MGKIKAKRIENRTAQRDDILIPGLPIEIAILCIARVPRSNHFDMSGVSRSWRNLLHGTVLSEVRRELSLAEEWLYLWTEKPNVWHSFDPSVEEWFELPTMLDDNRKSGFSSFASFDGKLFVLGGSCWSNFNSSKIPFFQIPSRTVSYFDARSNCWKRAADLNVARANCAVGIINNRLYVFGGYTKFYGGEEDGISSIITSTAEVYDPIKNSWSFVSSMKFPIFIRDGVVLGDKFYGRQGVVYDAKMDTWEDMPPALQRGWKHKTTVLNGKVYAFVPEIFEIDDAPGWEIFGIGDAPGWAKNKVIRIKVYSPWDIVEVSDARDAPDAWDAMYDLWMQSL